MLACEEKFGVQNRIVKQLLISHYFPVSQQSSAINVEYRYVSIVKKSSTKDLVNKLLM